MNALHAIFGLGSIVRRIYGLSGMKACEYQIVLWADEKVWCEQEKPEKWAFPGHIAGSRPESHPGKYEEIRSRFLIRIGK